MAEKESAGPNEMVDGIAIVLVIAVIVAGVSFWLSSMSY